MSTHRLKNELANAVIGLFVVFCAFTSVFGNAFERLKSPETLPEIETQEVTQEVVAPRTPTTPSSEVSSQIVQSPKPQTKPPVSSTPVATSNQTPSSSGYTLTQISSHDSATSCWSAINGTVYDLTGWVNRHPGGKAAILMTCGKDGSGLYNMQHGHSNRVASILEGFRIGSLQ